MSPVRSAVSLLALLALAACSTAYVPPRYYALALPAAPAPTVAPAVQVAIASVSLPEALDRANLVLRSSPTRIEVLDNDRWAEGLRYEIPRVLAARLNTLQTHAGVSHFPQAAADRADYALDLDVQALDAERGQQVRLNLRWTLRHARGDTPPLRSSLSQYSATPSDASLDAIVAATGDALDQFARELAPILAALPPVAPKR